MDGKRRVKVGIVGCGNQASTCIHPSVAQVRELEVVATCDLDEEKAKRAAGRLGAPRWYTDLDKMLANEEMKAAIIVGPPPMHEAVGTRCLEAGLKIFTEKPSTPTLEGAKRLLDLARAKGLDGQVGFMKRSADAYRIVKELIGTPEFGDALWAEKKFYVQNPYRKDGESDEEILRRVLLMQAVHAVDLVRFLMGNIVEVDARVVYGKTGTLLVHASLAFEGGGIGAVQVNTSVQKGNANYFLEVVGERAQVRVDDQWRLTMYSSRPWTDSPVSDNRKFAYTMEPHVLSNRLLSLGHFEQMARFARCLIDDLPLTPNLEDNYRCWATVQAMYESCLEKRAIRPEDAR